MDPKIKKQWVKALRSGKYRQGREVLKDNSRFCCLGVLCDLHRKKFNPKSTWRRDEADKLCYLDKSDLLPPDVIKWACLEYRDPITKELLATDDSKPRPQKLSELNDHEGESRKDRYTFKKIADIIERDL